ncbi:MAG: flagellar hook-basal body complex protein FliE [Candidatus Zixiibacteriota bacterium]
MSSINPGPIRPLGLAPAQITPPPVAANLAADLNALDIPQETRFADLLGEFVNSVGTLGDQAESATDTLLQGGDIDLHEVMIAGEEAGIAFDLLLEIRNRLVEAYQEVIRMPL